MTTIFLHGYLRDLHPDPIRVESGCAAEALSALQLIPALAGRGKPRHHVRIPGFESEAALYERRNIEEIHVHPMPKEETKELMSGSGRPGVANIVIGALIITTAFVTGGVSLGALGTVSAASMIFTGSMMVLGGVLQILAPQPKATSNDRSKYLGAGKNTVAIGTRIPLIYGRVKAAGQYISFNVDALAIDSAPATWYSSPFTDYGDTTYSAAPPDNPLDNPQAVDQSPVSSFQNVSVVNGVTYINFTSTVLQAGPYDVNFANGKILHVSNDVAGSTTRVTLLSGDTSNMPASGTNIVFTRNYG